MTVYVVSDDGFESGKFRFCDGDVVEYINDDTGTLHVQSVENVFFDRSMAHEEYSSNFDHITTIN